MPIYDFDGTAKAEVGKVYDNDGSVNHQIGKVYDHDGTAAAVIYSGEEVLYDSGMVVPFEPYTYVSNSNYVYAYADNNETNLGGRVRYNLTGNDFYTAYAGWRTSELYNLSNYSAVTIKAEAWTRWDSYNGVKVALFDANNNELAVFDVLKEVGSGYANSEWTFDLSEYNSLAKVGITAWQSYSNGRGAEFKLYKMTLS